VPTAIPSCNTNITKTTCYVNHKNGDTPRGIPPVCVNTKLYESLRKNIYIEKNTLTSGARIRVQSPWSTPVIFTDGNSII